MTRTLIITSAVLLLLGGVFTAFSGAEYANPGPAILLQEDPAGETGSGHGSGAAEGAEEGDGKPGGDQDGGSDPFTVTHPQPVEAGDDAADDDGWDDDETDDDETDDDGWDDD